MKTYRTIAGMTAFFLVLLTVSIVSIKGQNSSDEGTDVGRDLECIKVSLSADSTRLMKDRPAILRVKIRNSCDRTVAIHEPTFYIERVADSTKLKYANKYGGRIIRTDDSEIDNTAKSIRGREDMEFVLYSNEIRWMMWTSSIDFFQDLFAFPHLKTGAYHLYCTVKVCPSCPLGRRNVESNKVEIAIKK